MAPTSADDVLHYLEKHPGFFLDHPEVVAPSGLMSSSSPENVLNIRQRLFDRLNEDRQALMSVLDETIELVRQNEKIESDFLAIEKLIFHFHPEAPEENLSRIAEEIERRFSLDHVSFLMSESAGTPLLYVTQDKSNGRVRVAGAGENFPDSNSSIFLQGNLREGASDPFPEDRRGELRSTAVVAIRESGQTLGLILLGSKDPGRYTEGMGTHLIKRLAMRLGMGIRLLQRFTEDPSSNTHAKEGGNSKTA